MEAVNGGRWAMSSRRDLRVRRSPNFFEDVYDFLNSRHAQASWTSVGSLCDRQCHCLYFPSCQCHLSIILAHDSRIMDPTHAETYI